MRDLCDTALSTYDAEQTNCLSSYFRERGTSFGAIVFFIRTRLRRYSPLETIVPKAPSLAHWRQCTSLYTAPVWGHLNGSLLSCLRKDLALCDTASRDLGRGGTLLGGTAHFMCTVCLWVRMQVGVRILAGSSSGHFLA